MPLVSLQSKPEMAVSEQITDQQESKDAWARQKNEPASLYLEFTAYRLLGRKRSLQALIEGKQQSAQAPESTTTGKGKQKNGKPAQPQLQAVKTQVPGHIKVACKKWRWVERAQAWDLHRLRLLEAKYDMMLQDGTIEFANPFRRIVELDHMAKNLELTMKNITSLASYLSAVKTMQSLFAQIASEVEGRQRAT